MFLLSPKKLNRLLLGGTLVLLAFLLSVGEVPLSLQLALFVLMMVFTGIPHGAVDHVVYQYVEAKSNHQADESLQKFTNTKKARLGRFFVIYMGIIAIYSALWLVLPGLCLIIFLLMSFYHFGQSQLYYLSMPEKSILKVTLYICWGALIISGIVFFNYKASTEVLEGMVVLPELLSQERIQNIVILLGVFTSTGLTFAYFRKSISGGQLAFEFASLFMLLALFHLAPLLVAFATYFGLWHSLKAIQAELQHFEKEKQSLGWFYRQAWPFSVISFLGIGILVVVAGLLEAFISPYMLFFIAISVLTMPHMYYMQKLYIQKERTH